MGIVGSHNSWSYLKPKRWWQRIIRFTAKCQTKTIKEQYTIGVRCFDLRVRFSKTGNLNVVHGLVEYNYSLKNLEDDLQFLSMQGDCYLRVIHDVRKESQHTEKEKTYFINFCSDIERVYGISGVVGYRGIRIFGGACAYDWHVCDYKFKQSAPTIRHIYASGQSPKIDDIYPYLYAKHNNKNVKFNTIPSSVIVMVDFVEFK